MQLNLPIINISNPYDPSVGKAMLDAAAIYGFLYVDSQSTDFTVQNVERAFELSSGFFASPVEEKATCRITPNNRGWSGMHVETLDPEHQEAGDFKEGFNFGEFQNGKAQQPLPPSLSPHEPEIDHFASLCRKTCGRILTLLALGLEIQPSFFTTRHDPLHGPSGSILRYLYYPSITSPATASYNHAKDVRAGAHSDYGSITLLFQRPGQPGLEILTPEGGWAPVPVEPRAEAQSKMGKRAGAHPPILVNIGDLLSYWTDGLLKSTVHRVIFPPFEQVKQNQNQDQDRYSIVYFCHPIDTTELIPVPSDIVTTRREECQRQGIKLDQVGFGGGAGSLGSGSGSGRVLTAHEHLMARLEATYRFES